MIACGEIKNQRKKRILDKYPPVLNWFYFAGDYLVLWLFPKLPALKKIYRMLTRGQGWVISRAEILGRIIHCGFAIVEEQEIRGMTYVFARKVTLPALTINDIYYGPLIHLKRIGKGGKMIKVYKLRTMHPYSEYLQEYIYKSNLLEKGGKIKGDYRITPLRRILRKFWLDELPMIWNLLRGDLKIVGVRPLSEHYFSLYSPEMKLRRIQYKPRLIPPFYSDMPRTFEEIEASEARYLDAYEKSPFMTDIRYFFKVLCNIVLHGERSG
jgi:lipopolysaccharide/colanic/teichoic acid biosynthesis glycosyltransferase